LQRNGLEKASCNKHSRDGGIVFIFK